MPPNISLPLRKAPYIVSATSPSTLSKESADLDAKTLLVFQDLDGESSDAAELTFEVTETVAKVVIHDVKNVKITLRKGIVTTLELFNATKLNLELLDSRPATQSTANATNDHPLSTERTVYGTVTMDPALKDVKITYGASDLVGAVILATPSGAAPERSISNVMLAIRDGPGMVLADAEGVRANLDGASEAGGVQLHVSWKDDWQIQGLQRKEKDYPQLS